LSNLKKQPLKHYPTSLFSAPIFKLPMTEKMSKKRLCG
jgi:hypothetical protein